MFVWPDELSYLSESVGKFSIKLLAVDIVSSIIFMDLNLKLNFSSLWSS